jgi:enoyl-CoA hydratase/carnithine racemase
VTAFATLRLERAGPVARLTFDRPRVLNAGNAQWVADFNQAVAELAAMDGLRVVVITGAGRAFSTGVDLDALAAGEMTLAQFVAWEDAMTAIERMGVLFIAAINGHCLGGGLQLALVCDYRLASEEALLGLPAVKECLIPSMSIYRLPRLIGIARARPLILTGQPISAREAERQGLVDRVVASAEFPSAVAETVDRFLALPATSTRVSKRLLARVFELGFDEFRAEMEKGLRECLGSAEHATAMDAIRRRPRRSPAGG